MRTTFLWGSGALASLVLLAGVARAADGSPPYTVQAEQDKLNANGLLREETVSVKPMVGVLAYKDALDNNTSRGAAGLSVDGNITNWFTKDPTNFFVGPQTGAIFSHLGSPTSNFFGTSPDAGQDISGGANMLIVPANLKAGYNFGNNLRVGAHGGGNVTYRSTASAINTGSSNQWVVYPNAGGDVDFGLAPNVSLTLRPDWTITPGNDIFSGMLGLGVNLG